jgi:hypothetical protein
MQEYAAFCLFLLNQFCCRSKSANLEPGQRREEINVRLTNRHRASNRREAITASVRPLAPKVISVPIVRLAHPMSRDDSLGHPSCALARLPVECCCLVFWAGVSDPKTVGPYVSGKSIRVPGLMEIQARLITGLAT